MSKKAKKIHYTHLDSREKWPNNTILAYFLVEWAVVEL